MSYKYNHHEIEPHYTFKSYELSISTIISSFKKIQHL